MKTRKDTRTALGEAILTHWREHCPRMVRDLEQKNCLDQTVFEAQTQAGDLLYELVSVKKMDYQTAWELAREEWALPQENQSGKENGDLPPSVLPPPRKSKSRKPKPKNSKPANSTSPTSSRRRKPGRRRATSG